MAGQIHLRGDERRTRNWNFQLEDEIKPKFKKDQYSASFGIMGGLQTGKKTLATRFENMQATDASPKEDGKLFFNSFHVIEASYLPRTICLHLRAFICPPKSQYRTTFNIPERNEFCCMVFLCDIIRFRTFKLACRYMRLHSDIQTRFFVGNKLDSMRGVPRDLGITLQELENAAASQEGVRCFEISAKSNQNVLPLLEAIQNCAIQERYKMTL